MVSLKKAFQIRQGVGSKNSLTSLQSPKIPFGKPCYILLENNIIQLFAWNNSFDWFFLVNHEKRAVLFLFQDSQDR